MMNIQRIAIKKLNGITLTNGQASNTSLAHCLNAEMIALGYVMSKELFDVVATLNEHQLEVLHKLVTDELKNIVGADVSYRPMYPNFPQQVMDASDLTLFINAIAHYWTHGRWSPSYTKKDRSFYPESVNLRELKLVSKDQVLGVFTSILSSRESISAEDKEIVEYFLNAHRLADLKFPDEIPFKETMCIVAAYLLKEDRDITPLVKTATDILRIVTKLSDGDVSLAENTQFKSLPRAYRKKLTLALEKLYAKNWQSVEEDIKRHSSKWVKLFHSLHVGDHSKVIYALAKKVRENEKLESFNGRVEHAIKNNNLVTATMLLKTRPTEYARRLDHLLRLTNERKEIIDDFAEIADKIPTKVLMQVLGHLKSRTAEKENRIVFPKGVTQRATVVATEYGVLKATTVKKLTKIINESLIKRFSNLAPLGKVYIDPELKNAPLPAAMRSASRALVSVARGTKLPIGEKSTLRFFVYWKGRDIDLTATFHDKDFKLIEQVSWTNLRSNSYKAYHSGDITYAPNGASEFIDVDIPSALKFGAKYVLMNVYVFNGPTFKDHEVCYAGWMTRNRVNSNEIYDPKTVEQKIDITAESMIAIPVVFDLEEGKAIWTDLATKDRYYHGGRSIHTSRASVEQVLQAMVTMPENRATLYDLFSAHGKARGKIVDSPEKADIIYGINSGQVTAKDITVINSEYLV